MKVQQRTTKLALKKNPQISQQKIKRELTKLTSKQASKQQAL
jgi:uncharacterized protein YneF (UPF0154 family)